MGHKLVFGVVVFGLAAMATTVMAGAQWSGPQVDASTPGLGDRCSTWDVLTPAQAKDRDDWLAQCGLADVSWNDVFSFYSNRGEAVYPTFGSTMAVWQPDRSRDAAGRFTNCSIPAGMTWLATCKVSPAGTGSVVFAPPSNNRCRDEGPLSNEVKAGRIEWAYACNYLSRAMRDRLYRDEGGTGPLRRDYLFPSFALKTPQYSSFVPNVTRDAAGSYDCAAPPMSLYTICYPD